MNTITQAAVATISAMTYNTLRSTSKALGIKVEKNITKPQLLELMINSVSTVEGLEAFNNKLGIQTVLEVATIEQDGDDEIEAALAVELALEMELKFKEEMLGGSLTEHNVDVLDFKEPTLDSVQPKAKKKYVSLTKAEMAALPKEPPLIDIAKDVPTLEGKPKNVSTLKWTRMTMNVYSAIDVCEGKVEVSVMQTTPNTFLLVVNGYLVDYYHRKEVTEYVANQIKTELG